MMIVQSEVKKLIREKGKQASKDFLVALDRKVYMWIVNACNQCKGTRLKSVDE
jgi:hypothetical protein